MDRCSYVDSVVCERQGMFTSGVIHDDRIVPIRVLRVRILRVSGATEGPTRLSTLTGEMAGTPAVETSSARLRNRGSWAWHRIHRLTGSAVLQLLRKSYLEFPLPFPLSRENAVQLRLELQVGVDSLRSARDMGQKDRQNRVTVCVTIYSRVTELLLRWPW